MMLPEVNQKINERFNNNFDFLRFLAAFFVIVSHSYTLSQGRNMRDPLVSYSGLMSFGDLGIAIFFIISGYLILKSWDKKKNILVFFKNRVLRIFPALTIVVLTSVFILGPVVTMISWDNYFRDSLTLKYLYNLVLYIQFLLPGVFLNNPYPKSVNGSLWTLPIEFSFYIVVAVLGLLLVYRNRINLTLLFFIESVVFILFPSQLKTIIFFYFPFTNLFQIVKLALFFSAGMLIYSYKKEINFNITTLLVLFSLSIMTFVYSHDFLCMYILIIFLSYTVMYVAFLPQKQLNNFGKYGDFSYGLYVYAFPIQQTLVFYITGIGVIPLIVTAFICTLLVAITSWYLIESPCLNLKDKPFF